MLSPLYRNWPRTHGKRAAGESSPRVATHLGDATSLKLLEVLISTLLPSWAAVPGAKDTWLAAARSSLANGLLAWVAMCSSSDESNLEHRGKVRTAAGCCVLDSEAAPRCSSPWAATVPHEVCQLPPPPCCRFSLHPTPLTRHCDIGAIPRRGVGVGKGALLGGALRKARRRKRLVQCLRRRRLAKGKPVQGGDTGARGDGSQHDTDST